MKDVFDDKSIHDFAELQALVKELEIPAILADKELNAVSVNDGARRLGFRVGDDLSSRLSPNAVNAFLADRVDGEVVTFEGFGAKEAHVRSLNCGFFLSFREDSLSAESKALMQPFGGRAEKGTVLRQHMSIKEAGPSASELDGRFATEEERYFDPTEAVSRSFLALKRMLGDNADGYKLTLDRAERLCSGNGEDYRRLIVDIFSFVAPFCKGKNLRVEGEQGSRSYIVRLYFELTKKEMEAMGGLGVVGGLLKESLDLFVKNAVRNGWYFLSERVGNKESFVLELPVVDNALYVLRKPVYREDEEEYIKARYGYYVLITEPLRKKK